MCAGSLPILQDGNLLGWDVDPAAEWPVSLISCLTFGMVLSRYSRWWSIPRRRSPISVTPLDRAFFFLSFSLSPCFLSTCLALNSLTYY